MERLPETVLALPVVALAERLLGTTLLIDAVGGIVVETEAYRADDPASHSFIGQTPRNRAMFGPAGRLYVYRSYGIHWCVNLVGAEAPGAAVLLRALAPTHGLARMQQRRGLLDPRRLCAGPGRLCAALGIDRDCDGARINDGPVAWLDRPAVPPTIVGPRIGISKAIAQPWRFGVAGSRFLSRPFPRDQAGAGTNPSAAGRVSPRE